MLSGYPGAASNCPGCEAACSSSNGVTWCASVGHEYVVLMAAAEPGYSGFGLVAGPDPNHGCSWRADGCFADYNNDGSIDGDDAISFFAEWNANGPCADSNLDQSTDGDDVILFFGSWDNAGIGSAGC